MTETPDVPGATSLIWRGSDEVPTDLGRSIVTIGVFDGVHRGHQAMVRYTAEWARQAGLPAVVITFDPHPSQVVRQGPPPAVLSSIPYRAELLQSLGADHVLVLHFSASLSRLTPREFVQEVLVDRLHAAAVLVGENFRFGHRAVGTVATLRDLGRELHFDVATVELAGSGDVTWSSTYIRQCIAEGDVEAAATALGHLHRVEGVVVHGDHRGRVLGFPTANLQTAPFVAIPEDGVYAGWLSVSTEPSQRWPAAISVGTNPTFEGVERRVEAYALDRDDLELYDAQVAVEFAARIRGMVRFDSVADLVAQMADDVTKTRALLALG